MVSELSASRSMGDRELEESVLYDQPILVIPMEVPVYKSRKLAGLVVECNVWQTETPFMFWKGQFLPAYSWRATRPEERPTALLKSSKKG